MNWLKKGISVVMILAIVLGCMCVSAFAASGTDAGICDVQTYVDGVTVMPMEADGTAATQNAGGVYVNAARVLVTFSGATANKYYLLTALDGEGYPTVDNVIYMDQLEAGTSGSVSFNVYPKELKSGQTYTVYLSSNDGVNNYQKVASFSYFAPASYVLGDVNGDGEVESVDALRVLRGVAKQIILTSSEELAADANRDGEVESVDALRILRYVAKQIPEL